MFPKTPVATGGSRARAVTTRATVGATVVGVAGRIETEEGGGRERWEGKRGKQQLKRLQLHNVHIPVKEFIFSAITGSMRSWNGDRCTQIVASRHTCCTCCRKLFWEQ